MKNNPVTMKLREACINYIKFICLNKNFSIFIENQMNYPGQSPEVSYGFFPGKPAH